MSGKQPTSVDVDPPPLPAYDDFLDVSTVVTEIRMSSIGSFSAAPFIDANRFRAEQHPETETPDANQSDDDKELIPAVSESEGSVETKTGTEKDGENSATTEKSASGRPLTEAEQEQVRELKQRDREVRAHEQAHLAAAGQYASGGPSYTYQTGPDGGRYAVGGEVGIDTSAVPGDPAATIRKAQQIRRAAHAPADPSAQDRAVAAAAAQLLAKARVELREIQAEESESGRAASGNGNQNTPESTSVESASAPAEVSGKANPLAFEAADSSQPAPGLLVDRSV